MKVLIATEKPFAKVAVDGIRQEIEAAGYELALLEKYTEKAQLLDAVKDADAVIIRSDVIDNEVFDAAKQLKIVVRAGAGYDNVDLAAATAHHVVVMNTPGQNSNAVAELVFGLLIYAVRNFYNGKAGTELKGKKLGILAFGNVGRNVARIAAGFGMDIYAYDAFCPKEAIEAAGVHAVDSTESLFDTCDIVSLHIPATPETKNSINYDLVNRLPKGGILINTARKEVIDETGLIKLMEVREDLKYISDIAPASAEEFAAKFAGRYFATPKKMGAQTAEANINAGIAAAKQIVGFLRDCSEKRSKFLAFAIPVRTLDEVKEQLKIYEKKYYDARHVCYAYMLGAERTDFRANDNGEPSGTAGRPILGQINSFGLTDILVVVVRYFGGIKLGTSGLIVAYKAAAQEALNAAEVVEKTVDAEISFLFEYPFMNDVMRIVKEESPEIVSQDFDNDCRMTLRIRKSQFDRLRERLCKVDSLRLIDD